MRILGIIPPYIPSYFNAGHHLPLFQVGSFLKKHLPLDEIVCMDCAALNITWKEICNTLTKGFDLVLILNDFDAIDTFERFMYYKSSLTPEAKTLTFGRLSKQIPHFFFQFGIDAVQHHGDYEAGILSYVHYLKGMSQETPGVLRSPQHQPTAGVFLEPEEWVLPDVTMIPYGAYHQMYKNDFNKFCGIPERQELVVPLARGCPVNCAYCDVPSMQGKVERRLSVDRVIDYIQQSFNVLPFEYVSFYAPTFTLNHKWVDEFCSKFMALKRKYPWKCVTVLKTLNPALIKKMSESGCIRISLGIESFSKTAAMELPKVKQETLDNFINVAKICLEVGIELNCFIMLGMPGDTPQDIKETIDICRIYGARVRPTIYTNYGTMRENMSVSEINKYNRQILQPDLVSPEMAKAYHKLFYNDPNDVTTHVMNNIPEFIDR